MGMASIVCLQSSDLIAPLSLHLTYRDDLFPRQEYRHTFDRLLDQLPDRQACKTMVELLALAHDRGCERELAERISGGAKFGHGSGGIVPLRAA